MRSLNEPIHRTKTFSNCFALAVTDCLPVPKPPIHWRAGKHRGLLANIAYPYFAE